MEDATMQDIVWTPVEDDRLEMERETLRQSLIGITNAVGVAMRDAGLVFPLYATVPNSGESVATIATPLDPSDADWERATTIFCKIAGKMLGGQRLRARELPCAVANGTIGAADIIAEAGEGDAQQSVGIPRPPDH
jgi:hypothetical protein